MSWAIFGKVLVVILSNNFSPNITLSAPSGSPVLWVWGLWDYSTASLDSVHFLQLSFSLSFRWNDVYSLKFKFTDFSLYLLHSTSKPIHAIIQFYLLHFLVLEFPFHSFSFSPESFTFIHFKSVYTDLKEHSYSSCLKVFLW